MSALEEASAFDRLIRGWRGYALTALIALTSCFVIGATAMPVMDGDEARFAQASRQMAETGDYVRIRLMDADRTQKPIGIYWLQALTARAFEPLTGRLNTIWPYRVPSALGAIVAAMATLWGGAVLIGRRAAFFGASLLAASLLFGAEGMTAKTDAALLGATTLAMAALAHLYAGSKHARSCALVFWAALACGLLLKFAVSALVVGAAILALAIWERRFAWLKPLAWAPGPLLALAILAPWPIAISLQTHGGFLAQMFARDVAPKLAGQDEHGAPPGYYLALLPLLIFPATYALPAAARHAWSALQGADASSAATRFLIAWAVPAFVFFEIMPSKLLHYALPTYPAIALVCGAALVAAPDKRLAFPLGLALFTLAGAVLSVALGFAADFGPQSLSTPAGLIGGAITIVCLGVLVSARTAPLRLATLVVTGLAFSLALRGVILPNASQLNVTRETVAALARANLPYDDAHPLRIVGYDDASLAFATRSSTQFVDAERAANHAAPGDTMIVENAALGETQAALGAHNLRFAPVARISGRTTSDGSAVTLEIGQVGRAPPS